MSESIRLVTAEELEKFPDDGYRYELVEGRLIRMSPVGYLHGKTVVQMIFLLQRHISGRRLGVVFTELGVKLASNPDTVRAPDVAFIRPENKTVAIFRPSIASTTLRSDDDFLDLDAVGARLPLQGSGDSRVDGPPKADASATPCASPTSSCSADPGRP